MTGFHSFGYVTAALLAYFIISMSDDGWRIAIFITALPIFLVIFWRRALPETPRWLESRSRLEEADKEMTKMGMNIELVLGEKLPVPTEETVSPTIKQKGRFLLYGKRLFYMVTNLALQ